MPSHASVIKRGSVLIVDDHIDNRETLAEFLAFDGFTVSTAPSGIDALGVAERTHPDVVLMDLWLAGELDGFETTRRLKAHPTLNTATVIAITGLTGQRYRDHALNAGCHAVFTKPFELDALAGYISRAIEARQR